jgi:putative protease
MELLAPAGDFACLEAALEAGADAVYLGLTSLNARRRARNFSAPELSRACELAHGRGRRIYLTLNIDLAQPELIEAARMLELAVRCRVDAVLVRDPALLALKSCFPELAFHFSTQSCVTSGADVEAARELGLSRVVLAREMSLPEIREASQVPGVETEVFAQGALCFSVSGRCLLASWVGGRSGNRGQCTSPCRVPWTVDGAPMGTPLSMHDLSVISRIEELTSAGVRALKIEGRLKTAAWVRSAVSLYRRAIDRAAPPEELAREAEALGAYTGRRLTSGYLDGSRGALTGVSGRERASLATEPERPSGYSLVIEVGKRIECRFRWGDTSDAWELSRAEIKRPEKAVAVGKLLDLLRAESIDRVTAGELSTNEPSALLVPRSVNAISDRVGAAVRRALRSRKELDSPLRASVQDLLKAADGPPGGRAAARPDRARLSSDQVEVFLSSVQPGGGIVVEGLDVASLVALAARRSKTSVVAALPSVFFEDEHSGIASLCREAARLGVRVEVNSWGGWWLAKRAGARMEAGPGLGVLNSLAARKLEELGCSGVTASVEIDSEQLRELLSRCPASCSLVVFGRPALMTTRVALVDAITAGVLEDRRDVRLRATPSGGLLQLRPLEAFDWRSLTFPGGATHLVVDLVGSTDPVSDWQTPAKAGPRFNLERTLA